MSRVTPPPNYNPVVQDDGIATSPWVLFFNQLFVGDTGTSWIPTFQNLSTTGTPIIIGTVYKISQNLSYFSVVVTPSTDTTATAGVTYIDNFPLDISKDGACIAVSGVLGGASGACVASNNRIYVPSWTAVTVPVTITGTVEAR